MEASWERWTKALDRACRPSKVWQSGREKSGTTVVSAFTKQFSSIYFNEFFQMIFSSFASRIVCHLCVWSVCRHPANKRLRSHSHCNCCFPCIASSSLHSAGLAQHLLARPDHRHRRRCHHRRFVTLSGSLRRLRHALVILETGTNGNNNLFGNLIRYYTAMRFLIATIRKPLVLSAFCVLH